MPAETAVPRTPAIAEAYRPPDDPRELLKIDAPMRRYFAERLSPRLTDSERLREIVDLILQPQGMNFAYEVEGTYDVRETFRRRRGNCVSFSFLALAVAREFGLAAAFQSIDTAARWNRFGEIVASVMHVNVRVATNAGVYVVDLRPDVVPRSEFNAMLVVHDERAWAQFYNNVGFFRLVHGQSEEALRYMTKATETDPDFAGAWSNLANLQTRMGHLAEARSSYERALRLAPRDLTASAGLLEVMRRQGRTEDQRRMAKLERKAQALRDRSPYFQQFLGAQAGERGDWVAAERFLRRAIALKNDEPEFYAQQEVALQHLGRNDDARRMAVKLEKLRARLAATPDRIVP